MVTVGLLISGLCFTFISLGIIFCLIFLWLIFIRIRPLEANIPLILTCNTYLASLLSSIILIRINVDAIRGHLNIPIFLEGWTCQFDGYLIYIAIGSVFYSCILQAVFRLFRVVFYRRKSLYTIRVFSILILLQWFIICLVNLPFPLLNHIEYIASEFRCQIAMSNIRASLLLLFVDYLIPSNIILTTYFYVIRHVRQRNPGIAHRHDLLVLKRTSMIYLMIQFLSIPVVVIWLISIIENSVTPLSYQLQALPVAFSQSFIPIALAYSTPQIRERFKCQQRQRVQPVVHYENRAVPRQCF